MAPEHQHDVPEPGPKKPAPGELELVRAFVNTIDVEAGTENLVGTGALGAWLLGNGLVDAGTTVSQRDLRNALELREALRALLVHNNDEPLADGAVETLDRHASRARLTVRFAPRGSPSVRPEASGVDGALGRILAIVFRSMSDGAFERLKICRAHTCAWAFYDWSKNHSGAWCSMRVCGNRAKVRSYRSRARSAGRDARPRADRRARSSR